MAQGKAYNIREREEILERLKPYFLLGYNRYKACTLGKFDSSLLLKWEKDDMELSKKIDSWIEYPTSIARQNIVKKLNAEDVDVSKWWLERKDKDMTNKSEVELYDNRRALSDEELKEIVNSNKLDGK